LAGQVVALPVENVEIFAPTARLVVLPVCLRRWKAVIYVLSPVCILLQKERESIAEFQAMEQRRLEDWKSGQK
jgi:hypothetical protein